MSHSHLMSVISSMRFYWCKKSALYVLHSSISFGTAFSPFEIVIKIAKAELFDLIPAMTVMLLCKVGLYWLHCCFEGRICCTCFML